MAVTVHGGNKAFAVLTVVAKREGQRITKWPPISAAVNMKEGFLSTRSAEKSETESDILDLSA